jgi:hypothetical protein
MVSIALGTGAVSSSSRRSSGRLVAAGLAAGLALVFRFDFVLPIGLSTAVLLRPLARSRVSYMCGLFGPLLLYVPYLALAGPAGISRSVKDIRAVPAGRRLPLPSLFDYPDGTLLLGAAVALILVLAAGLLLRRARRADAVAPLAVGLATVGSLPFVLQRADGTHIETVGILVLGMLPLAAVVLSERFSLRPVARRLCGALVVVALVFGVAFFMAELVAVNVVYLKRDLYPGAATVRSEGRTFIMGDRRTARDAQDVISAADRLARPGDSVFVGPYDLRRAFYGPTYL